MRTREEIDMQLPGDESRPRVSARSEAGMQLWRHRELSLALALAVVLAAVLGAASARPAAAQADSDQYDSGKPSGLMVEITGTLERLDPATYGYGEYQITDEDSGSLFALDDGEQGLLEPYVGQRVTVTGTEPGAGQPPQDPRLLNVMQVEPAGEALEGPDNTGSITFEVDTEGAVPPGTEFFGVYGEPTDPSGELPPFAELGIVNLHDGDNDGTYTGVADVPRGESLALVARGDAAGPEQQIHPRSAVQRDAAITVDGNETVSTNVTFPEAPSEPEAPDPAEPEAPDPPELESPDLPGQGAEEEADEMGIEVLPDTGGPGPLAALAAGLALLAAGFATIVLRTTRGR